MSRGGAGVVAFLIGNPFIVVLLAILEAEQSAFFSVEVTRQIIDEGCER
jgi:hypothetical protein